MNNENYDWESISAEFRAADAASQESTAPSRHEKRSSQEAKGVSVPKRKKRKKKKRFPFGAVILLLILVLLVLTAIRLYPRLTVSEETPVSTQQPEPAAEPAAPTPEPTPESSPEPAPEPTPEFIRYTIPEDALIAPAPNSACYGVVSPDNAEEILAVIQQARDSGLLGEDETVAFDPDVEFYRGVFTRDIEYYLDDTILVILWKEVVDGKSCTFTEVKIADASQFRRKLANDTYGSQQTYYASALSKEVNAVVAMNADYYLFRDVGIVVSDRELHRFNTGTYTGTYKKYNCVETLFIDAEGDFLYKRLGEENTEESIRQFIADNDILFSIAFGPVLVENREAVPCTWYPVGEVTQGYSRAGIGQMGKLHYLYMSLDHGEQSANWTVNKFAECFARKPVQTAFCLDGGQTGEVVFRNEPYSHIDFGEERTVSDIIYFATAIPEDQR